MAVVDNMNVIIVKVVTVHEMVAETVDEMVAETADETVDETADETVVVVMVAIDMETTTDVVKTEAIITIRMTNQHQHQFTVGFSLKNAYK